LDVFVLREGGREGGGREGGKMVWEKSREAITEVQIVLIKILSGVSSSTAYLRTWRRSFQIRNGLFDSLPIKSVLGAVVVVVGAKRRIMPQEHLRKFFPPPLNFVQ